MIQIIDITFYCHSEYTDPSQVLHHHRQAIGYAPFIIDRVGLRFVNHLNFEGYQLKNKIDYAYFKGRNKFFHIPFAALQYIKKHRPDVALVQGLCFPVQVILLRLVLGGKGKILVQHHAERPFKGVKMLFQKIADRCIDGYLFTAVGNASEWKRNGIINANRKCYEVLEGAAPLRRLDKRDCRELLGLTGTSIFLWVGGLMLRKDPITILKGFEAYVKENPDFRLYMIYQWNHIYEEVKSMVQNSIILKKTVTLVGEINNDALETWYSAADFFIAGSHNEGSGYALIESMSCGCIPIVTNIPPFRKITGGHGVLFTPGNPHHLYHALRKTNEMSIEHASADIVEYARQHLSYRSIADSLYDAVCTVLDK